MKRIVCASAAVVLSLGLIAQVNAEETTEKADNDQAKPRVKMETTLGDIVLELYPDKAPATVENFLTYVREDYYNGLIFHRVIPNFMIQGGGLDTNMDERQEGKHPPVKLESQTGLKNERGAIAMARTADPNSATSQFFINVVDNPNLDHPSPDGHGYAVFGKVVEGMDTVDKIRNTETIQHPKYPAGPVTPKTPVVIKKVYQVDEQGKPLHEAKSKLPTERKIEKSGAMPKGGEKEDSGDEK